MKDYLSGKKSYIIGGLLVAAAAYSHFAGYGKELPTELFIAGLAALGVTLRAGISKLADTPARPTGKN